MILLRRTLPFLLGASGALLLWSMSVWTQAAAFLTLCAAAAVALCVGALSGYGRDLEGWWHVALTSVIFVVGCATFLLFMEAPWVSIALPVLAGIFLFFFGEHLFRFIHVPSLYQPYALEHTSLVLHIASIYFLKHLLRSANFSADARVVAGHFFLMLSAALIYERYGLAKRDKMACTWRLRSAHSNRILCCLRASAHQLLCERGCDGGAVYTVIGMMRASLLQKLSRGVLRRYLLLGVGLSLLLLLTAQWI